MKPFCCCVALFFSFASATVAWGEPVAPLPLVSTSGTAEVKVVPDLADLWFTVEVRDPDLATARKKQEQRMSSVLAALREAGIAKDELNTSQAQITPNYRQREQETDRVQFYTVSQNVGCTLHNLKKIPDVTASVITAGATEVGPANLRTSKLRKYRDEARAAAIRAAKEKAAALAAELDVKIGKPYTISENSGWTSVGFAPQMNALNVGAEGGAERDESSPTFAPGTISVTATVSVSFRIE